MVRDCSPGDTLSVCTGSTACSKLLKGEGRAQDEGGKHTGCRGGCLGGVIQGPREPHVPREYLSRPRRRSWPESRVSLRQARQLRATAQPFYHGGNACKRPVTRER